MGRFEVPGMSMEQALIDERKKKTEELRAAGVNPFANDFRATHTAAEIQDRFGPLTTQELEADTSSVAIAGRVLANRSFGKAAFVRLQDRTGQIQLFVKKDEIGAEAYEIFRKTDIGDVVAGGGPVMRTKTGELSILAKQFRLLTRSHRPLPEKWHGLTDVETRYRQRYVDLIVNPEVRETFRRRARIVQLVRRFLDERGFLEVETPMLHPIAGGAAARPFITHHNTLDMELYLRIAPELYLKRLVVGGLERVYEINRNFRNEGISTFHNPEFTMLEFYQAYATYEDLIELTETLFEHLAREVVGSTKVPYQGSEIEFARPWRRQSMYDAIRAYTDAPEAVFTDRAAALQYLASKGMEVDPKIGPGKAVLEIFERLVEPTLIQPTFITDFPLEVSPLSRKKESNPALVDRFELYIAGREIANAFSELNDPDDQRERFLAQVNAKAAGDEEAMPYDEDYIRALEHGMPPAAGEGIGIDRITMLLTDSPSIRDVILFPLLRPTAPAKR
jgi:lysyl-tRNA synthetase class 2